MAQNFLLLGCYYGNIVGYTHAGSVSRVSDIPTEFLGTYLSRAPKSLRDAAISDGMEASHRGFCHQVSFG